MILNVMSWIVTSLVIGAYVSFATNRTAAGYGTGRTSGTI